MLVWLVLVSLAAPLRVAVSPLEARGLDAALVESLEGVVLTRLGEAPDLQVLATADVLRLLAEEQRRQLLGCGDDSACVSRVVDAADASRLVWGSVGRVGESYLLTLTLLDTENSNVLRRVTREARALEGLTLAAAEAAQALVDVEAPIEGCVDCGDRAKSGYASLMLGNNFMGLFAGQGMEVALLAPGMELDVGYRFFRRVSLGAGVGLSFGRGEDAAEEDVRFQLVPVNVAARYHVDELWRGVGFYTGLGLGVGFVRSVANATSSTNIKSAFSAETAVGLVRRFYGGVGGVLEASYGLTLDTPRALRSQPLGALAVRLGLAYGL